MSFLFLSFSALTCNADTGCDDAHAVIMEMQDDGSAPWRATIKGDKFPGYVCQAKCQTGYLWHPGVSKCLMVVDESQPL